MEDSISITTWTVTLVVTFLENKNINIPPQSLATLNNNKGIRQNPQSHHMLLYLPLIHSKTTKAVLKWQALSYPDIYGTNAGAAQRIFFRVVTKKLKLYKI